MALIKRSQDKWVDPLDMVSGLQQDMNRLFSSSLLGRRGGWFGDGFVPEVDLEENEQEYMLHLDVPGVSKKDIDVSVTGDVLFIRGQRKHEEERKDKNYVYAERRYGSFQRAIELPGEVDADKVKASYKDGVLELTIPKSERAKPRQIKVDVQ